MEEKNVIRPYSTNITDKLPPTPIKNSGVNLAETGACVDACWLLEGVGCLGEKTLIRVNFGGAHEYFLEGCCQMVFKVSVKVPEIWDTADGLKVVEEPQMKEVVVNFKGDGIIDVYLGVQDDNYYLEVNFDTHNWRVDFKNYALSDMLDAAIDEYMKFPVK